MDGPPTPRRSKPGTPSEFGAAGVHSQDFKHTLGPITQPDEHTPTAQHPPQISSPLGPLTPSHPCRGAAIQAAPVLAHRCCAEQRARFLIDIASWIPAASPMAAAMEILWAWWVK